MSGYTGTTFGAHVTRPDKGAADVYSIWLDEGALMWLEQGTIKQIAELEANVVEHRAKCKMGVRCVVQQEANVKLASKTMIEHGTVSDVALLREVSYDCSEDMMFLHTELAKLYRFLYQTQYLRNNPTETSAI